MGYGRREDPKLFNDEQMRQYIADGYVVFKPDVPDDLHETVRQKLQFMVDEEFNYGNNVLPRVPEMDRILNSPEVRGALISVLGPGYIEHPHRFCHYISPDATQKNTRPKLSSRFLHPSGTSATTLPALCPHHVLSTGFTR